MEQNVMTELEKVEQLVDKAGCTYAEAKDALEYSDWNLLDAIIKLEHDGKAHKSSASYASAEPQDAPKSGSYAEPEVIRAEDAESMKPEGFGNDNRGGYGKGSFGEDARHYGQQAAGVAKGFFARAKEALTKNYMTVLGRAGNQVLRLPMWVLLLLLLCWFWGVILIALAMMVFGCRFHFEGRDFGRININDTFDKAQQAAYDAGQRVKEEFKGKQNEQDGGEDSDR